MFQLPPEAHLLEVEFQLHELILLQASLLLVILKKRLMGSMIRKMTCKTWYYQIDKSFPMIIIIFSFQRRQLISRLAAKFNLYVDFNNAQKSNFSEMQTIVQELQKFSWAVTKKSNQENLESLPLFWLLKVGVYDLAFFKVCSWSLYI